MVRVIAAISFAVLLLVLFAGQSVAVVNQSSLKHCWFFTNGTDSITYDGCGDNNLTVNGATYLSRGEYLFNSADVDFLRTVKNITADLGHGKDRTFIFWVNSTRDPGDNNWRAIFASAANWGVQVGPKPVGDPDELLLCDGITNCYEQTGNMDKRYEYYMVSYVHYNSTGRSVMYLNDTEVFNLSDGDAGGFNDESRTAWDGNITLGKRPETSDLERVWNGTISMAAAYNRTLTSQEIADWYAEGAHFELNPPSPSPEPNIWNLSGKNVFVTNTSRSVAIGATVPSQRLHVNGSANITGTLYLNKLAIRRTVADRDLGIGEPNATYSELDAGATQFTASSSREYKQNIVPIYIKVLDKIAKIPVNTYDFKPEYCGALQSCTDKLGLIAEDFHTIFERGSDKELDGNEVQMALWLAVQELKEENDRLTKALCAIDPDAEIC